MLRRASGVLMHVTSLPSRFGIGDFGPGAQRFARFLRQASQSYWQILPLSPTSTFIGNSPYSSDSAFAVSPLLISPEAMVEDGWLDAAAIEAAVVEGDPAVADFEQAQAKKETLFRAAFAAGRQRLADDAEYIVFCREAAGWLDDYALFRAAKREQHEAGFASWPAGLRDREPAALDALKIRMADEIEYVRFVQFLAHGQWKALRAQLRQSDIQVIGACPSTSPRTAPTSGPIRTSSSSARTSGRSGWPGCRRIISAQPASAGAIRSTTGRPTRPRASPGGCGAWNGRWPSTTSCAWTIFGALRPTGKSRPAKKQP